MKFGRQPDLEDDKYLLEQEEKAPGKEGNESIKCDRILEKKQTSDRNMSYLMKS